MPRFPLSIKRGKRGLLMYIMRKISVILSLLLPLLTLTAQRQMEKLDRGVVAVNRGGGQYLVSWRLFATDPEDIAFNVYAGDLMGLRTTKLNTAPITNSTNYLWSGKTSSQVYVRVKPVVNGVEGAVEGEWFIENARPKGRIVRDYDFHPFPAGFPAMSMKFCWPGDLDGDGKYDFVLDRHPGSLENEEGDDEVSTGDLCPYVEAYNHDGSFKWRIKMGANVITSAGHSDMVTVYDMNGDNKAEVLLAVSEGTTFPDGTVITGDDGKVTDYNSTRGSAPQWVAIVDGATGHLIDKIGLTHFDEINSDRTDKWKHISGHFVIAYLDGIRPSLVYQYKTRAATGHFHGAYEAWSYEGGKLVKEWSNRFPAEDTEYEGHQVRVGDVDGDGKDEVIELSYAIDHDGSTLYRVPGVQHGDRHCLADIDPDRPGLEHFFIQQTNFMGMGLHDATTGEMIKGLYMATATDVGRGMCAAFDPTRRGLQFFSTMSGNAMYDAKAKEIPGAKGSFPSEALWWGGSLARMEIDAAGSDKNPILEAYNPASQSIGRSVNLYRASDSGAPKDYYFAAPNGGRAAFWGDILGDWREELIYARRDKTGFVIFSTWDVTEHRQYCLMQNPAYRGQTTARGYYQTADVDFYMAADMPLPPVAPVQKADVYLTNENQLTAAVNGKSAMLDIRNPNAAIALNSTVSPTCLWLMNPKGKNYTIGGTGKLTGGGEVIKSMQGDVTLNGSHDYTGVTRVSEGRLFVNGTLASKVRVDARGTIGGKATLNGGIVLETGLNVEGGRIEPGNGTDLGTMTIEGGVNLPGRNNLAFDIDQTKAEKNDRLVIKGDFLVEGNNHSIVICPLSAIQSGELTLVSFTGTTNATVDNFTVKGLEGVPYELKVEANAIKLQLITPRAAGNVAWNGMLSDVWDFRTKNFKNDGVDDLFVPGDAVSFGDNASAKDIVINEEMPVGGISFANDADYTIKGEGVISGNAGVIKTGKGKVSFLNEDNTFTGKVDFSDGILEVASLKDGGVSSSIGASTGEASNWIMRNATLRTASQMATNRSMQVVGKLTVDNPASNNSVVISGDIVGDNTSLELTGEGMLNIQGKTSFDQITIKGGALALGAREANRTGLGKGNILLEGGTLRMSDFSNFAPPGEVSLTTFDIEVPEGATATLIPPSRWKLQGNLTGKGTFNFAILNNSTPRLDLAMNWSTFEGRVNVTGTDFRIDNAYGYEKATLHLANNLTSSLTAGRTIKIGGLSGTANTKLGGSNTKWIVGGNNVSDLVFNGTIVSSGSSSLTKEGTGTWTLTGANTYPGGTIVNGGCLLISNTEGSGTGTGTVTVNKDAKVGGTGRIAGSLLVNAGASLYLKDGRSAKLTVGQDVYLTGDAVFDRSDVLAARKVTILGESRLELEDLSGGYAEGTTIKLFETTQGVTGKFAEILPQPGAGLAWSQDRISEGIVLVVVSSSLPSVNHEGKEIRSTEYYDAKGMLVDESAEGFIVRKTIYRDGSVSVEKLFQ